MNSSTSSQEFFQAVLESFVDGIVVLTEQKEQQYANETAKHLCQKLTGQPNTMPGEVWQACETLIESHSLYGDRQVVIEHEVETESIKLQIRVQWFHLGCGDRPYLLVRLQDQTQALQGLANAEAQTWGLTDRETQVWMLRRSGWKRKDIATELYIALETVRKHLRNIQAKRQSYLDETAWRASQIDPSAKIPRTA